MKIRRKVSSDLEAGSAENAKDEKTAAQAALMPRGGWKIAAYFLSLVPGAGLALGILFAGSKDPAARRFGRVCLGLAVLGLILGHALAASSLGTDSGDRLIESFY